jgi:TonB family protein
MMNPNPAQFGGSFQQPPPRQQKGCWGRYWKVIVPAGCLSLILAVVLLVAGIFFAAMSALKSSDVYQGALKAAQAHPAAIERLGQPIKDGWFVKGSVNVAAGGGSADLEIPVSGPKSSGTLYVTAVNPDGSWMYEKLNLVAGGETVSLLDRNVVRPPAASQVDVEGETDEAAEGEGKEPSEGVDAEATPEAVGSLNLGPDLDAKALDKPEPAYPAAAKAARASGTVAVLVVVDESGRVVAATPVSGHPLLRQAAVQAARQARFAPTIEGGKPLRVTGVLTYKFALE